MPATTLVARFDLVDCPHDLLSVYDDYPVYLMELGINARVPKPSLAAVLRFRAAVEGRGGRFRIVGWGRSYDVSQEAYQDWIDGKRDSVAKPPGYSFHNSWCALDIDVDGSGLSKAVLDECAAEAGLHAVSNERWHYELRDGVEHIIERYNIDMAAMVLALGAGLAWFGGDAEKARQAALHYAGRDAGIIDGVAGTNTWTALDAAGMKTDVGHELVIELRSSPYR